MSAAAEGLLLFAVPALTPASVSTDAAKITNTGNDGWRLMDLTITISPNACESPMTEEDCGVAADAAGKSRGGCGYDFVGAVSAAAPHLLFL